MLKQFTVRKLIFGVIAVMCISLLLSGCGGMNGSFYTLNELYENESITREEIMNIAALRTGSVKIVLDKTKVEWEFEEIEFDAVEPESPLSSAITRKIEKDFRAVKEEELEEKLSECRIIEYYGTYGDFIMVEIKFEIAHANFVTIVRELVVDNVYLGAISMERELVLWRENSLK